MKILKVRVNPEKGVSFTDPNIQAQAERDANPTPFPDITIPIKTRRGTVNIRIRNGRVLINGKWWKVELVDGHVLKEKYLTDFCEGGHFFAGTSHQYKFMKNGIIWVDRCLDWLNRLAAAVHEIVEICFMTRKVNPLKYEPAHEHANAMENVFRHEHELKPSGRVEKIDAGWEHPDDLIVRRHDPAEQFSSPLVGGF